MSPIPRREVCEIIALHKRQYGRMQEVYVEGAEDKAFYQSFLRAHGLRDVAVFAVGTVEIPTSKVLALGLADGEKGRVVALAEMLDGQVDESEVVCIADADFDHFEGRSYPYALLLLTDYAALEVYLLLPRVLEKVLSISAPKLTKSIDEIVVTLSTVLIYPFLLRLLARDLALGRPFPNEPSSFCLLSKGELSFRTEDYIKSLLGSDRRQVREVQGRVEDMKQRIGCDLRYLMNGHDTIDVLVWYLREHGYKSLNPATFKSLALVLIDFEGISKERLFSELLRRLMPQGELFAVRAG